MMLDFRDDDTAGISVPKVLILCKHYLPGFKAGGPIKSIANLCSALGERLQISVLTLDRDADSTRPYTGIETNTWNRREKENVLYLPSDHWLLLRIARQVVNWFDGVIYLNSFFDPRFSVLPMMIAYVIGKSYVIRIAPRGELSDGALSIKSTRKLLFLKLVCWVGLYRNVTWHATSEPEVADIQRWFPDARKIHLIGNIPNRPPDISKSDYPEKIPGRLKVVFLSRITPKKNLSVAIEAISKLSDAAVQLDIIGPIRDQSYWDHCQTRISSLPSGITVNYRGECEPDKATLLLKGYDLLFLPTLGENFGHVIVEALSVGCPVLISDQTPWNAVVASGCGWICPPDDVVGYVKALSCVASMDNVELMNYRHNANAFAKQIATFDLVDGYRRLLCKEVGSVNQGAVCVDDLFDRRSRK